jgi:FkbM family methyltransferase
MMSDDVAPSTPSMPSLLQGRYGVFGPLRGEDRVARCLRQYGEWAEEELDLLSRLLLPGDRVVELGANHGAQTLRFSHLVGEQGWVLLLEPDRLAAQQASANLALNAVANVYIEQIQVSHLSGAAEQLAPGMTAMAPARLRVSTLDELALESVKLIKINTPGLIQSALSGAVTLLDPAREQRPCLYFELGGEDTAKVEVDAMKAMGYRCWSHVTYLYNPDNHARNSVNAYPGRVLQNVLALPADAQAKVDHLVEL